MLAAAPQSSRSSWSACRRSRRSSAGSSTGAGAEPGRLLANLLALAQTLLVAQVGARAAPPLATTGAPATTSTTSTARSRSARCWRPGCTRRREGPQRLLWFAGTSLLAAALAVRAFMTGVHEALLRRAPDRARLPDHRADRARRRRALAAVGAADASAASCGSPSSSRSRSSSSCSGARSAATSRPGASRSRNVFYAAIVLAVVDIGAFIGLGAERPGRARVLPRARRLRLRDVPRSGATSTRYS